MKMMKLALLGGAALAVTSAAAYADDLSALKAEIEALNSRVAQLEATPSVPAGYSLMTVTTADAMVVPGYEERDPGVGKKATVIGILPAADAPASTSIEWSGYVRTGLIYSDTDDSSFTRTFDPTAPGPNVITKFSGKAGGSDLDIQARSQIKVVGKTDTAVGEVGALVKIRGDFDGNANASAYVKEAWGWWKMTPELTLGGGYAGTLGNIRFGYDGACSCYFTDNADVGMNPGDTSQMRLSYASGPLSFAIALEDATGGGRNFSSVNLPADDSLGAAAEIKYAGDSFSGEISGYWRDHNGLATDSAYGVGIGGAFSLGDIATISLGTQVGQYNNGVDFWRASILGTMNLSDSVHAELAYGHTSNNQGVRDTNAVLAGIYYDPVSQLTIGLEGEWFKNGSYSTSEVIVDNPATIDTDESGIQHYNYDSVGTFVVDLVTVFRF